MPLPRQRLSLSTTAVFTLIVGVLALAAFAPPASAASTYTFYVSGSAVGQTSPGAPHDYVLNITNLNASSAISFNLSVVALPQGWTGQLSQSAVTVGPVGTQQVTLSVTPPGNALADSVGKFVNVTATPDDNTTAQTVSTTTRVTETFGVSLSVIAQSGTSGDPGANVTWLAYLQNTGNSQQTYTVTVNNASFTNTNLTTNLVTVQPGETRVVQVWINISQSAQVGNLYSYIRAVSTTNASSQQTVDLSASVNAKRAVSLRGLTADDLVMQTESEASVVFPNIIVSNDGNVADAYLLQGTANASRHGSWVSFANANVSLAAFSQQYLSVTVTVPASASATGDYTVEFRIISQNSTTVIAFLNLTVTVTAKHDLSITFDDLVAKRSGDPGTAVSFPVNVSNPGAFTQRVDLTYAGPNGGWVSISATPFTLAPGGWRIVYYNFTVPGTQAPTSFSFDAQGTINWSSPSRARSLTLTLEVRQVYGVIASSAVTQGAGLPGATVNFTVLVRNNGTGLDNFTLQVTNTTQAGLVTLSSSGITGLAAGAGQNVTLTVQVQAAPAPSAGVYFYTLTAVSSGNGSRTSSVQVQLTVEQVFALSASVTPGYKAADPGQPTTFTVTVANNGNGPDVVTLQRSGTNQSWLAVPGSGTSVPAGGQVNLTVTVTAPSWAAVGDTLLTVVAVSGGNANVSSSTSFTVSLNAVYSFALTQAGGNVSGGHRNSSYVVSFVLRNSGNQPDTYTIALAGADAAWVTLPGTNFSLNPNENVTVDLAIDTGATPANGNHTFTLTATSVGASIPTVSAGFTVNINDIFRPEVRILSANYPTVPGATVTVSYTLRNNGTLTDTILLEATARFPSLQQFNRTVTLAPGATSTASFTFTADYPYTGSYRVDIVAASTVEPTAVGSAYANITLEVDRRIEFLAPNPLSSGGPGGSAVFNLSLKNVGNITDTYNLTSTPYGTGWSVSFSVGSITLAPGEMVNFTATVTAPAVLPGTTQQYASAVGVLSTSDNAVRSVLSLSVSVSYSVSFQLAGSGADLPLYPGQSGSYTLVLNNTGSARDTYTLTASGLAAGWVTITPAVVPLDSHQTATVTVSVLVPPTALEGGRTFRVTAAPSSGATLSNNELTFTVTVQPVLSFAASGTDTPVAVLPGASALFLVTITNTGNALDTYSLVATVPQYVSFAPSDLTLAALETGNVTVTFAAPAGAAAGLQTLKVTVYGSNGTLVDVFLNASVSAVHNLTARGLPAGNLSASGAPGSSVDLTFEVTNGGNGADVVNWTVSGPAAAWTALSRGTFALPAGSSTTVTMPFVIPADALAGPFEFTVDVVAQGQSAATSKVVRGVINVGGVPGVTFSLDATSVVTSVEATVDAAPQQAVSLDYSGFVTNTGNRVEVLTITRQVPQGQGWSVLVNGLSTYSLTLQPGEQVEVSIQLTGFPASPTDGTATITLQSEDGRIDQSLAIGVQFAKGVLLLDANSIQVTGGTHVKERNPITISFTVRNTGTGSMKDVTVELSKDGSLVVDSETIAHIGPGQSLTLSLTWVPGSADTKTSHTLVVGVQGKDMEAVVPGTFVIDADEQGIVQRLTSDTLLPALLLVGLLVGFVLGFALRGGRRKGGGGPAVPAGPVDDQQAALAGLDELEAEGGGAVPAEVAAVPPPGGAGSSGMEHKVICPNCAMEQWIVGKEGECPNCGVVIEVDEGGPGAGDDDDAARGAD